MDPQAYKSMTRGMRIRFEGRGIEQVFVPINIDNVHWVTGIIDMRRGWIQVLDQLGAEREDQIATLLEWLKRDSPDRREQLTIILME